MSVWDIYETTIDNIMDGSRDIQKTDNLAQFLDGYIVRTNPFGRNSSGERAYRRAERLVAALHILTNHVPPQEPARSEARHVSLGLLSNLLALRDEMRVSVSPAFRAVQASVRELISLVRALSTSGYISFQNAGTVIEALDELGNFLMASQRSSLSESVTFSKDDLLGVHDPVIHPTPTRPTFSGIRSSRVSNKTKLGIKDRMSDTNGTLSRRAQSVLEILKSQGTIGIRDIASNFPEYSEKMIQRELAYLIKLDRVKKVGFKRWSKYSFVR
ncbi:MAG: hypothetical protein UY39_C0023G0009 [Candidatus Kaiserbacteria bacterium GW2011_GWC2_49_12]|uniref:HTH deoR-type domain-containing protein n=4 Tax=Candidatus Kaiseribacteriota TaxID=1752734 RepID=A0A0G1YS65_9BACT|nr:MAG: hypothetical protein UY39_C0023G0009 [Candidatus Kaiserbacteria bacterium GW2011_GWC2_49_12]KKW17867.1 MAG: hypothetical protein UY57_C0008G0019 [Candidatus Kaiserbacteria bacterium GW2011_GWB1_50_17]KKW18465.1 MAG: hypothetical protein UY59_C0005G0002 [Candidatus Kaiserbacteria bacterium GW2011_GWA1_50_28]OGG87494.1 MAG: hypothetical protein A3H15_02020 [Candidatus Kaiserbacteria bacterium RIFCSPLOWO2_12_FULL_50_28]HCM43585.1 hypothetical protein [Candidatus Kaiserbacteria bacterium]